MEDLRNGATKIGKSITPGKRERTLQSEEPKIVMRFSIPADEALERQMHQHFDSQNLRGEWFSLNSNDLIWLISTLRNLGDMDRAFVDYEWLGKIFFKAKSPQ